MTVPIVPCICNVCGKNAKEMWDVRLGPVPRDIAAGCGYALKLPDACLEDIVSFIYQKSIAGKLLKCLQGRTREDILQKELKYNKTNRYRCMISDACWFFISFYTNCPSKYKCVHYNKVAETPAHYKKMEYFMTSEILVPVIEDWKLQCIDDAADGIDNPSGQQPAKGCCRHGIEDLCKCEYACPAHADIQYRGYPFGAIYPKGLDQNPDNSNPPYN